MPKSRFVPLVVVADNHDFVGRIFDLAMPLELGFKNNRELNRFADCLYVMQVYWRLSFLIQRAESLNIVQKMLQAQRLPASFIDFPITRYEWLTVAADTFLMRFVSVFDCCMLLTNDVFECGLCRKPGPHCPALSAYTDRKEILTRVVESRSDCSDEKAVGEHCCAFSA